MVTRPYPSFLIYLDQQGEFRWRYQASNAKVIADSGEGYKTYADCNRGIQLMKQSETSEVWETQDVVTRNKRS